MVALVGEARAAGDQPQLGVEGQLVAVLGATASGSRRTGRPRGRRRWRSSGRGSQPVGLRKKPGRSTVISIFRSGSGTPPNSFGMSLVNTSTPVSVERSTTRRDQDHVAEVDRARLGRHVDHDRGRVAGLDRLARGTGRPRRSASCPSVKPTVFLTVPTRVSAGQLPACASASWHFGTAARLPTAPAGSESLMLRMFFWPSPREMMILETELAPAVLGVRVGVVDVRARRARSAGGQFRSISSEGVCSLVDQSPALGTEFQPVRRRVARRACRRCRGSRAARGRRP